MLARAFMVLILLVNSPAFAQSDVFFEVPALNAGLDEVVPEIDRLTPQTAIWSFLEETAAEDFDTAAHLLNLNDIPVDAQAQAGPILAQQLAVILDRKVVISWQSLLERPDALNASAPSDNPMAGQARRSLLLGVLEVEGRPVAIRLNRVKPENGDAVWVFSRQTVSHIPALHDRYGPSEFEQALPQWLRDKGPFGLFWWELIGLPIAFLLAGLGALFTWRSFKAVEEKLGGGLPAKLVHEARLPATLMMLGAIIWVCTAYIFVVSGLISSILEPFLVVLFVAAAMFLLISTIDGFLEHFMVDDVEELASPSKEDTRAYATTMFALRRLTVAIAVLLGIGITLATTNVFRTLGFSLLAGAGGLTLLLGFAAREVLGNILASLQISANRSARVGDQLIFEDRLCTVERIHFSFVQLKVWDGTRLIVPVSEFVSESFINRTLIDSDMVRNVVLTIAPAVDLDALRGFYHDWMDRDDRVGDPDSYECYVVGQDEFGLKVRFCALVPDPRDGWDVECELREALVTYLNERQTGVLPNLGSNPDQEAKNSAGAEAAE